MGTVLVWMMAFALLVPSLGALSAPVCPATISLDFVMVGLSDTCSPLDSKSQWASPRRFRRVMEVDEVSLQKMLNLNERNSGSYVAIFFHASWCPFSKLDMPTFVVLSSLFPSINHVAVEESTIRPSVLSKYGVRGFPTVILQNSTTWAPYHGSKRLGSLVSFYMDATGIKPSTPDLMLEALAELLDQRKMELLDQRKVELLDKRKTLKDAEVVSSPFSWVRSPEKLLQQESYLALATSFLVLRLVYVLLPSLLAGTKVFWRRYMQHMVLRITGKASKPTASRQFTSFLATCAASRSSAKEATYVEGWLTREPGPQSHWHLYL